MGRKKRGNAHLTWLGRGRGNNRWFGDLGGEKKVFNPCRSKRKIRGGGALSGQSTAFPILSRSRKSPARWRGQWGGKGDSVALGGRVSGIWKVEKVGDARRRVNQSQLLGGNMRNLGKGTDQHLARQQSCWATAVAQWCAT